METFTFWGCVRGAWVDGWRYIRRRPVLVMAFFLPSFIAPYIEAILRPAPHLPFRVLVWLPLILFELLRFSFIAALSVDTLRHLLPPEGPTNREPLFGRSLWRYVGVVCAMLVGMLAIAALVIGFALGVIFVMMLNHVRSPLLSIGVAIVGASIASGVIGIFLITRLSLLSTHVAIGGTVRIAAAWRDSRGRFWTLWLTQFVATLPFMVIARVTVHPTLFLGHPSGLMALLGAVDSVVAACVAAACAAWLYRRYAQSLRNVPLRGNGAPA